MILQKHFDLPDLMIGQVFYIYESKEVIIVNKDK